MASLIRRIQAAFLGSGSDEELQALLAELGISSGSPVGNPLREARRGFLRSISDEAILRDALNSLGVTGGGGGGMQAVSDIRNAILYNLHDSEATLRQGLDGLLTPEDLGGGDGASAWVPANAKIHIDFLGGSPQGRAWSNGAEVAIDTLLGSDPNTEEGWDTSGYDPGNLTADGYAQVDAVLGFIGSARSFLLAGATVRVQFKIVATDDPFYGISAILLSADGNDAIEWDAFGSEGAPDNNGKVSSWSGTLNVSCVGQTYNLGMGAVNALAITTTAIRADVALSGSDAATGAADDTDRPPGNPLVAAVVDVGKNKQAIQSITIYDPLPTTAGLSELSEVG